MEKIEIDGVEVEYEIEPIAGNSLFKFKIDNKEYEVFAEMLVNGYGVGLNWAIEKYDIELSHQTLIKHIISSDLEDSDSYVEFG